MKMVKSLLLGSAAGLVAVAGAQAADLPVKAKPVQYVKICTLYGDGYYYIPGSDTCIKIGGYIRADYGWNVTGARTPHYSDGGGARDRTVNEFSTRHRANVQIDTRTQTQYGTLRTLTSLHFQNENQSESFNVARAFIQWAGFTFGRAVSYSDTWGINDSWHYAQQQNNSDTGANGVNLIAYTWELGNGFSFSIGADERRTKAVTNLSNLGALRVGAEPSNQFAGERMPDFNVSFKVDQAWGYWAVAAVAHDVRATYYTCSGAAASTLAPLTSCGAPDNTFGWGVMTGAEFKLPFIAPGDRFGFNARYAVGASGYGGGSNLSSPALFASGNNVALGFITDAVFTGNTCTPMPTTAPGASGSSGGSIGAVGTTCNSSNLQLTTTWTVGAGYEHNWTDTFKSSFTGAYSAVRHNATAKSMFATYVCPTNTFNTSGVQTGGGQGGISSVTNCDPDFSFFQGGIRTQWTPVPGFFLGVDLVYTYVWTAFGNGTANLNGYTAGSSSGNLNVLQPLSGARPGGTYTLGNQGIASAVFRAQRNFNAGGAE